MDAHVDVAAESGRTPPRRHRAARRRGDASRRRPAFLVGALAVGGLVAGLLGFHGNTPARASSVLVAQALETTDDDAVEGMPQASITLAEAQARLQEVTASRAQRAEAEQQAQEAARPKAVLPIHGARFTSCFCGRWGTFHNGIDLAAPMYTPEYAAEDGVVLRAGPATGFGLAVYILHADGYVTVYGHMDSIKVGVGQYVQAGQTIALLGMRGESTGPHLHFEVHRGGEYGTPIDPVPWLAARGVSIP